jgi:hypothetical protein
MSTFNFNDYQSVVAKAQANAGNVQKVGFFKLKNDGDVAVARLNISTTDDLAFASVHTISANGKWLKVSCMNPLGSYTGSCPLCNAVAGGNTSISKAAKKVYIQMMVSYRDPNSASGYTAPAPVIWERPAGFSKEIANKLMIAGDLRNTLVLITRNGAAGDMQTTYSMDLIPATHPVFKSEMVPNDFSAFANFNIAKHSYWEKTVDEINAYLTTGSFPEVIRTNTTAAPAVATPVAPAYNAAPVAPVAQPAYSAPVAPVAPQTVVATPVAPQTVTTPAVTPVAPATQPATTAAPARSFNGFSF